MPVVEHWLEREIGPGVIKHTNDRWIPEGSMTRQSCGTGWNEK